MSAAAHSASAAGVDEWGVPLDTDFSSAMPDANPGSVFQQARCASQYLMADDRDPEELLAAGIPLDSQDELYPVPSIPWFLRAVTAHLRQRWSAEPALSSTALSNRIRRLDSLADRMRTRPGVARLWWELALQHNDPDSGLPSDEFELFLNSCDVKPDPSPHIEENDADFDPSLDSESEAEFNEGLAAMSPAERALAVAPGQSCLTPELLAAIVRGDFLPPEQRAELEHRSH